MPLKKRRRRIAAKAVAVQGGQHRGLVIGEADPQLRLPALAQPVAQTQVVGVHVGHDHPPQRRALQVLVQHRLPMLARHRVVDAAIHRGPAHHAIAHIAQQPQIDVVQGEGQAHAQPKHARGHLQGVARCRQLVAQGVVESVFEWRHG